MSSESEKAGQGAQNAPEAEMAQVGGQVGDAERRLEELRERKKKLDGEVEEARRLNDVLENVQREQGVKKAGLQRAIEAAKQELENQVRELGHVTWRLRDAQTAVEHQRAAAAPLESEMERYRRLEASVSAAREQSGVLEEASRVQSQRIEDLKRALGLETERAAELGRQLAERSLANHADRQLLRRGVPRPAPPPAPPPARGSATAQRAGKYVLEGDIEGPDGAPAAHDDFKVLNAASGKYLASGKTDAKGHMHIIVPERSVIVEVDGVRYPQEAEPAQAPKAPAAVDAGN